MQQDLQVQPERPVLHVEVVELGPLGDRRLPPQPVHLRPAGDAGLDAVAVVVAVDVLAEELDELRPLGARPDEAHLALQDVQELRQLVDRRPAEKLADARPAVDPFDAARGAVELERDRPGDGLRVHRAELENLETAAVATDPRLAEEHARAERDANGDRGGEQEGREEDEQEQRNRAVRDVLERELDPLRVHEAGREEREPADVVDPDALRHPVEEPRDEGDLHAELLAAVRQPEQHVVRRLGERDDHLLDAVSADDVLEVPARAEHRQVDVAVLGRDGLLVEEPDRPHAELGMREQPLRREPADVAGADDERRPERVAAPPRRQLGPVQQRAAADQVDGGETRDAKRLVGGRGVGESECANHRDRHRGDRTGGDDRADVVQQPEAEPRSVEPATPQEPHREPAEDREPPVRRVRRRPRAPHRARLSPRRSPASVRRPSGTPASTRAGCPAATALPWRRRRSRRPRQHGGGDRARPAKGRVTGRRPRQVDRRLHRDCSSA